MRQALSLTHQIVWWSHLVLAFSFLALFTYSKMAHVLFIPGNYYYRSLKPAGTLEPIDFEDEELETIGRARARGIHVEGLARCARRASSAVVARRIALRI